MSKRDYIFLRKLIGHKNISLEKGVYTVWGVKMFFFPYNVFVILKKKLEKEFPKKANDLIYSMGFVQAYNGTKVLIDVFGIKNDEEMHDLMRSQGETFGFGDFIFSQEKLGKRPISVKKTVSPIAEEYKNRYKNINKPIDYYNLGLIVGASQAWYKKNIVGVEKKCIAKGDKECEFEIKALKTKMPPLVAKFLKKEKLTTLLKKG